MGAIYFPGSNFILHIVVDALGREYSKTDLLILYKIINLNNLNRYGMFPHTIIAVTQHIPGCRIGLFHTACTGGT